MSYEVTKQIKGREYRYRVESIHDAHDGKPKQKWTYLGRIDGDRVVTGRKREAGDARERIVAALAALLEKRDLSHLTIDVIARAAHVSRPTFYRCFADRDDAVIATMDAFGAKVMAIPHALETPIAPASSERERLADWSRGLLRALVQRPGLERAIATTPSLEAIHCERKETGAREVRDIIVGYLRRLDAAGVARVSDPELLAGGIIHVIFGVHARVVQDRAVLEGDLLESAVTMIDRAVFGVCT